MGALHCDIRTALKNQKDCGWVSVGFGLCPKRVRHGSIYLDTDTVKKCISAQYMELSYSPNYPQVECCTKRVCFRARRLTWLLVFPPVISGKWGCRQQLNSLVLVFLIYKVRRLNWMEKVDRFTLTMLIAWYLLPATTYWEECWGHIRAQWEEELISNFHHG